MIEICYRAWDTEAKIMYPNIQNHIGNSETAFGFMIKNDRYIIMKYSGNNDKNKKLIFEGDIVKHRRVLEFPDDYHTGEPTQPSIDILRIGKCVIRPSRVLFVGKRTTKDYHEDKILDDGVHWEGWLTCLSEYGEVIGNIYQNPELLCRIAK